PELADEEPTTRVPAVMPPKVAAESTRPPAPPFTLIAEVEVAGVIVTVPVTALIELAPLERGSVGIEILLFTAEIELPAGMVRVEPAARDIVTPPGPLTLPFNVALPESV